MNERTAKNSLFRRHPRWTLSAVALFGCAGALIMAEIGARVLFPRWAPTREERVRFWTYSELLGWEHSPHRRGRFNHPDFSMDVVINSHGMRDDEYSVERTGKKRMLVLGDSFGWGFGVEHQLRFSEILERTHSDWEILHASVSGYGTDQEFLYLQHRGISFRPDVVLLLFYANDFSNNKRSEEYWYFKPFFVVENDRLELKNVPVPEATVRQKLDRFLLGRTYLGPRLYSGFETFLGGTTAPASSSSQGGRPTDIRSTHAITCRLIAALNELCSANGARFVLVSIPMGEKERALLHEVAKETGIPYLPLDDHFESAGGSATFPHDEHWNVDGHAIAANAIDGFLQRIGIFESPGAP